MKTYSQTPFLTMLCFSQVQLAMLGMMLSTGIAMAQDAPEWGNVQSGSIQNTAEKSNLPFDYRTAPAGEKPSFSVSDCVRLSNFEVTKAELVPTGSDVFTVGRILDATSPKHGYLIFANAPKELMWWVRVQKSISFFTLGTAVHEANHAVNKALTQCNGGAATYLFNGTTFKTEYKYGDTPSYAIVAETLPLALTHQGNQFSRYQHYIVDSRSFPGNNFSVLLDELVAHTGAAALELAIICSKEFSGLLSPEFDSVDSNAGGMVEFMIFTLAYLKALRSNYPDAYTRLKHQPRTLSLIQTVWVTAEDTLTHLYAYTPLAKKGGRLFISQLALSTAYADEFILELDRLGISHVPASFWANTYFKDKM